jgi:hypothetical protein
VITLARAYLRDSRPEDGLPILRGVIERLPEHPYAWDTLLAGLDDTASADDLARCLAQLPPVLDGDPRFLKHRGAVALRGQDWPRAVEWYLKSHDRDPSDGQVLYRLCQALKVSGRAVELGPLEVKFRAFRDARERVEPAYKEANAVTDLGVAPHPELCRRLAALREGLGRADEAAAWRRLAVAIPPDGPDGRSGPGAGSEMQPR